MEHICYYIRIILASNTAFSFFIKFRGNLISRTSEKIAKTVNFYAIFADNGNTLGN